MMFTPEELQFMVDNPESFSDEEIARAHDDVVKQPEQPKEESPWRTAAGLTGGAIGEVLAAPATIASGPFAPATAVGAGTLGYMGGTKVYDFVNNFINPETAPKDIGEVAKSTAGDIIPAVEQAALGPVAGKVTEPIMKAAGKGAGMLGDLLAKYKSFMTKIPKEDIVNYTKYGMPEQTGAETAVTAQQQLLDKFKGLTQKEGQKLDELLKGSSGQIPLKGIREPWQEELKQMYELKKAHPTQENIKDYENLLQSYRDKFNISGTPEYTKFQESIDPYSAWKLQHKMRPQAQYGAIKPASDAVQGAERRAARGSYGAYNEALASETSGVSQEMKNKITSLKLAEDELGNIVDKPQAMETFLRNYGKQGKSTKKLALENISEQYPELGLDKAVADIGIANSFKNPKLFRHDVGTLGLSTGAAGLVSRFSDLPALPIYGAYLAEASPALLKKEIQALRLGKKVMDYTPEMLSSGNTFPALARYFAAQKEKEE